MTSVRKQKPPAELKTRANPKLPELTDFKVLQQPETKHLPASFRTFLERSFGAFRKEGRLPLTIFYDWLERLYEISLEEYEANFPQEYQQHFLEFVRTIDPAKLPLTSAAFNASLGIIKFTKEGFTAFVRNSKIKKGPAAKEPSEAEGEIEEVFTAWLRENQVISPLSSHAYEKHFLAFLSKEAEIKSDSHLRKSICYLQGIQTFQCSAGQQLDPKAAIITEANQYITEERRRRKNENLFQNTQALIGCLLTPPIKEEDLRNCIEHARLENEALSGVTTPTLMLIKFAEGVRDALTNSTISPYDFVTHVQPWNTPIKYPDGEFAPKQIKMLHQIGYLYRVGIATQFADYAETVRIVSQAIDDLQTKTKNLEKEEEKEKKGLATRTQQVAAVKTVVDKLPDIDASINKVLQTSEATAFKVAQTSLREILKEEEFKTAQNIDEIVGSVDEKQEESPGMWGQRIQLKIDEAKRLSVDQGDIGDRIQALRLFHTQQIRIYEILDLTKPGFKTASIPEVVKEELVIPTLDGTREETQLQRLKEKKQNLEVNLAEIKEAQGALEGGQLGPIQVNENPNSLLYRMKRLKPLQQCRDLKGDYKRTEEVALEQHRLFPGEWKSVASAIKVLEIKDLALIGQKLSQMANEFSTQKKKIQALENHLKEQIKKIQELRAYKTRIETYNQKVASAKKDLEFKSATRSGSIVMQLDKRHQQLEVLDNLIKNLEKQLIAREQAKKAEEAKRVEESERAKLALLAGSNRSPELPPLLSEPLSPPPYSPPQRIVFSPRPSPASSASPSKASEWSWNRALAGFLLGAVLSVIIGIPTFGTSFFVYFGIVCISLFFGYGGGKSKAIIASCKSCRSDSSTDATTPSSPSEEGNSIELIEFPSAVVRNRVSSGEQKEVVKSVPSEISDLIPQIRGELLRLARLTYSNFPNSYLVQSSVQQANTDYISVPSRLTFAIDQLTNAIQYLGEAAPVLTKDLYALRFKCIKLLFLQEITKLPDTIKNMRQIAYQAILNNDVNAAGRALKGQPDTSPPCTSERGQIFNIMRNYHKHFIDTPPQPVVAQLEPAKPQPQRQHQPLRATRR